MEWNECKQGEMLEHGEVRVSEVVRGVDVEGEYTKEEEAHEQRLLGQIGKLRSVVAECDLVKQKMRKRSTADIRVALGRRLKRCRTRIVKGLKDLRLPRLQIAAVVERLKDDARRIESAPSCHNCRIWHARNLGLDTFRASNM